MTSWCFIDLLVLFRWCWCKNTAPAPTPGAVREQAVALAVVGDKAAFYGCGFYGNQDTLLDQQGRHFYKECFIEGSIDFIFGDAMSLYEVRYELEF